MKKTPRRWFPVLCLLALCIACSSPSSTSDTEAAIQQFYDSLSAEDYASVLGMYTADVRQMLEISGGQVDQGFVEWAHEETKNGKVDRIEIVDESVEADKAVVQYRVLYGDGSVSERSVSMTKEEDQWKLGFIDNI